MDAIFDDVCKGMIRFVMIAYNTREIFKS